MNLAVAGTSPPPGVRSICPSPRPKRPCSTCCERRWMSGAERYHGVLPVNKPVGMTSHDVVDEIRRAIGQRGGGHTGTLDPLADGLLVVCIGRATKISRYLTDTDKEYEATIRLGVESPTYDAEGLDSPCEQLPDPGLSTEQIEAALEPFRGEIRQMVPPYAAVRVGGKRLYKAARRGEEVERPVRTVRIDDLGLLSVDGPDVRLRIRCSKGTYIRSLAHDLGRALGCGAYLAGLRRTKVGVFSLDDSLSLSDIIRLHSNSELEQHLVPIERVLPFAAIEIADDLAARVVQGPPIRQADALRLRGRFAVGDPLLLTDRAGRCLAIGRAVIGSEEFDRATDAQLFSYERVLN
ncbi:tRNA pseudouridine(55) synthase TruB [candidate division GN15 bacterium]|nr:tRNA pseudouridine(55) synthase TruB [candidate division GN15 bacterium]